MNTFPTYLIAIAIAGLLCTKPSAFSNYHLPLLVLSLLFLCYLSISALWSDADVSAVRYLRYGLLVFTFLLSISLTVQRYRWFLYWLVLLTILAAVINSGYSIYLHYAYPDYQPLPEPRLYALGRLSNPVISALSYGFATVLAIYMTMTRERLIAKIAFAEIALLFLGAIVLTGSRGVWLALLVAIPVGVYLHHPENRKFQLIGLLGTITVVAITLFVFIGPELLFQRALSFRPEIWTEFVQRTVSVNLLFGTGIGSDSQFQLPELLIKHPHSILIATFYYGGMVGLFLYLGLIGLTIRYIALIEDKQLKLLAGMLLSFGLVATALDGNEIVTKVNYLWFVIWLPVGLAMIRKQPAP